MTNEKIKNSRELEFAVFCIENVAAKLGVDAERVYQAFTEQRAEKGITYETFTYHGEKRLNREQ